MGEGGRMMCLISTMSVRELELVGGHGRVWCAGGCVAQECGGCAMHVMYMCVQWCLGKHLYVHASIALNVIQMMYWCVAEGEKKKSYRDDATGGAT